MVRIDTAYMWVTFPSNKRSFLIPFSISIADSISGSAVPVTCISETKVVFYENSELSRYL